MTGAIRWRNSTLTREATQAKPDSDLAELAAALGVKLPSPDRTRLEQDKRARLQAALETELRTPLVEGSGHRALQVCPK